MVGTIEGDTEHWLAVVSLNDALSEYYHNDLRINRAALESGFTDEQWHAISADEQCLKSVDRPGKGRTFPGDRLKVPS
jgi:hypothetical protein